jgi:hypothetical protein
MAAKYYGAAFKSPAFLKKACIVGDSGTCPGLSAVHIEDDEWKFVVSLEKDDIRVFTDINDVYHYLVNLFVSAPFKGMAFCLEVFVHGGKNKFIKKCFDEEPESPYSLPTMLHMCAPECELLKGAHQKAVLRNGGTSGSDCHDSPFSKPREFVEAKSAEELEEEAQSMAAAELTR